MKELLALILGVFFGWLPESMWKDASYETKAFIIFLNALLVLFFLVILGAWFYNALMR